MFQEISSSKLVAFMWFLSDGTMNATTKTKTEKEKEGRKEENAT